VETSDAERRQLTVMFCDVVESTALASRLDPEELRDVVRGCQDAAVAAIEHYHGHVAQYLGDGLLVYFGWPHAHDDDAIRAVHAALAVMEAIRAPGTRGPRIELRIGIHTGPVVVGDVGAGARHEQLAVGETPNVAARLQALAEPATILVSGATARLLEQRFFLADLGERKLKGLADPVRVHRVTGETGIRSRFDIAAQAELLPLCGRDAEMRRLIELWDCARAGSGRVMLVSGEAGIGKSRLVQALKQHVSAQGHRWGSMRCSPYYSSTPLYPVIELWQQAIDLSGARDPAARLDWLERQLTHYGFELGEAVPLFADLLSIPLPADRYAPLTLDPDERRGRAIEGIIRITFGFAVDGPYLLVFEDLQWIDPTTAELLRRVAERVDGHPLFAVYTSRPRIQHDCGRAHVAAIELRRIADTAVDEMLAHLSAGQPLSDGWVRTIRERADGVPAYVEELGRFVIERARDSGDVAADHAAIPATLRDSLMARLDRTGPAKPTAQLGATIGRWFSHRLIEAVARLPAGELERHLEQLVAAGVLSRAGAPPSAIYSFRLALMQEIAYDSLLKRVRARYHAEIAAAIETRFPDLAAQHPELLAHHYAAAGAPKSAIRLLDQASRAARDHSAHVEAAAHERAARRLEQSESEPAG
jgi:class 3 adenylate cyclase